MHTLSVWFTKNHVAANLLMILILIAGFFTLKSIRIEGFPALPPSSVSVTTLSPGSRAEQVDSGISRKIEKALEGMPGIKKITSISAADLSTVWVQKVSGFDLDRFQNEIKTRVHAIATLPRLAERPIITRDEFKVEALLVQVYGAGDEVTLQKVARKVKAALLAHPRITKMTLFGLLPYEIRIEVDDEKLRACGMSLHDVAAAIERASLDYRTGSIKSEAGTVVIRADQKAFHYREFMALPLRTLPDGTRLLVADVARVVDGFQEESGFARFQRQASVGMMIYTTKKGHLIQVSEAAREVLDQLRLQLPQDVRLDIWGEYSVYMKDRLTLLATNGWQGLLIVFVLLALFLNLKLAFWVAMGIPISVAGTLMLMGDRFLGYSLNDITTFGMIVVMGILVDDAIVVGESVFESRRRNSDPLEGTIQGVRRVSTATVFGCFTTIAAFYPLLLIDNDLGKIFASFSVVVIVALLTSLVESKLILPAHLAALNMTPATQKGLAVRMWQGIQGACGRVLAMVNANLYQPLLRLVLAHRYTAMVLFATVAVCGIGLIGNGWIRVVFFPEVPGQIIEVKLRMQNGSAERLTAANIAAIEKAAEVVNQAAMAELETSDPPIAHIMAAMTGPLEGLIYAELQPEKKRRLQTLETLRRWRETVDRLEGVAELSFSGSLDTGGGFVVQLSAPDEAILREAVTRFTAGINRLEGVHDIRHDLARGDPQIRLRLKPEARHLGITAAGLARQIGDAFGGLEVQRIQRGADEIKVYVKYPEQRRRHLGDLFETYVRPDQIQSDQTYDRSQSDQMQAGREQWFPLSLVATIESGYVPTAIHRQNGRRVVEVEASLDKSLISAGEAFQWIKKEIVPALKTDYPQITVTGAGELEEMGQMKGGMKRALIMILILIYALLAVPLKSYWQPLVIMAVIPFGFVGAAIGHWVSGYQLSVLSFFGMLAAAGVVVNDSLVMLTRFNEIRGTGVPLKVALVQAGGSRFRAIVLTTVTTVCGLMPLLLETSEQAQYLIPAALSLAWGELFATPITLLLIPILINMAHDVKALMSKLGKPGLVPARR